MALAADPSKPGYSIGVLTNGSAVKPTCVCIVAFNMFVFVHCAIINWATGQHVCVCAV
jgi:hypothetical protein